MATKALITPKQYFATQFEREPELVRGELVERPLPTFPHGNIQLRMGSRLMALQQSYPVFTGVEVRVRIAPDLYRIPTFQCGRERRPKPSRHLRLCWSSRLVRLTIASTPCCKSWKSIACGASRTFG